MAKPISKANTFASQSGPIPLSQLDSDFDTLYTAINDPATYNNYLVDSGSANVIVVTYPAGISYSAYTKGDFVSIKVAGSSGAGTTVTLNINGIGAKNVKSASGSATTLLQLVAGGIYDFVYDGTNWILLGLDTSTSATFTGNPTFAPSSGVPLTVNTPSGQYGIKIVSAIANPTELGLSVASGTFSTDVCALFQSSSGTSYLQIRGDGLTTMRETVIGTVSTSLNAATYESGTFTGTLTGMTATTTGTVNWVRTGNVVMLYLTASITGTSNTTAMTMTGLPNSINPTAANQVVVMFTLEDNGGGQKLGVANVQNNNTIAFGLGSSVAPITYSFTGFTNSGVKGVQAGALVSYALQ